MAPAFSSSRQAAAFAFFLLISLLSPWLLGNWGLPPRSQIYSSIPWRNGPFPYIHQQIFEEKGDIDIAFMGSSHMSSGIDTPYVQKQLSEKLGRPAVVRSLCWGYTGFDAFYFIAKDLLEHRKVRLLVFYDDNAANLPHANSWRWIRFGDNAGDLAGLPWDYRISYYYGAVLGMPRNLLNRLRPNLSVQPSPDIFHWTYPDAFFPPDHLGAFTSQVAYIDRPDLFQAYSPQTPATPSDVCVYSPDTQDQFQFSKIAVAPLQSYFARKVVSLAWDHSTRLACLILPVLIEEHDKAIPVGGLWKDSLDGSASLVGIAPARLFQGLTDADVIKLYQDPVHLNQNGQIYFTRIVTPALIQLYEQANP